MPLPTLHAARALSGMQLSTTIPYPETRSGRAALNVFDTFFGYGVLRWDEEKTALVEAGRSEATTNDYWVFDPDSDEVMREARERGLCTTKIDDYKKPRA